MRSCDSVPRGRVVRRMPFRRMSTDAERTPIAQLMPRFLRRARLVAICGRYRQ